MRSELNRWTEGQTGEDVGNAYYEGLQLYRDYENIFWLEEKKHYTLKQKDGYKWMDGWMNKMWGCAVGRKKSVLLDWRMGCDVSTARWRKGADRNEHKDEKTVNMGV